MMMEDMDSSQSYEEFSRELMQALKAHEDKPSVAQKIEDEELSSLDPHHPTIPMEGSDQSDIILFHASPRKAPRSSFGNSGGGGAYYGLLERPLSAAQLHHAKHPALNQDSPKRGTLRPKSASGRARRPSTNKGGGPLWAPRPRSAAPGPPHWAGAAAVEKHRRRRTAGGGGAEGLARAPLAAPPPPRPHPAARPSLATRGQRPATALLAPGPAPGAAASATAAAKHPDSAAAAAPAFPGGARTRPEWAPPAPGDTGGDAWGQRPRVLRRDAATLDGKGPPPAPPTPQKKQVPAMSMETVTFTQKKTTGMAGLLEQIHNQQQHQRRMAEIKPAVDVRLPRATRAAWAAQRHGARATDLPGLHPEFAYPLTARRAASAATLLNWKLERARHLKALARPVGEVDTSAPRTEATQRLRAMFRNRSLKNLENHKKKVERKRAAIQEIQRQKILLAQELESEKDKNIMRVSVSHGALGQAHQNTPIKSYLPFQTGWTGNDGSMDQGAGLTQQYILNGLGPAQDHDEVEGQDPHTNTTIAQNTSDDLATPVPDKLQHQQPKPTRYFYDSGSGMVTLHSRNRISAVV